MSLPQYCIKCLCELVNGVCPDCSQEPTTTSGTTTAPSAATETPKEVSNNLTPEQRELAVSLGLNPDAMPPLRPDYFDMTHGAALAKIDQLTSDLAAKTAELEEARARIEGLGGRIQGYTELIEIQAEKLAAAQQRCAELEDELVKSFDLAEGQLASEKLAGNAVKENYWRGELAALHRIRIVLSQHKKEQP